MARVLCTRRSCTSRTTGRRAPRGCCCAASARRPEAARRRFHEELGVEVEPLRSPLGDARREQRRAAGLPAVHRAGTTDMKIPINLASQPFRRDRRHGGGSVAVGVLLVALLGVLVSLAMADARQVAELRQDIAALERAGPATLNAEQARARSRAAQARERRGAGAQRFPQHPAATARASVGRASSPTWRRCCRTTCAIIQIRPYGERAEPGHAGHGGGRGIAGAGDRDAEERWRTRPCSARRTCTASCRLRRPNRCTGTG